MGATSGYSLQKINRQNRQAVKQATQTRPIQKGEKGKLKFKEPTKEEYANWKRRFDEKLKNRGRNRLVLISFVIVSVIICYFLIGLF